ncbi:hypothetical protein [Frankia sp. QA3]|uniref:hypothetical protein n=1 Tax=Frankia sp. QA3 TaxID=710111 RepID=UPI000686A5D5|nr:hypothetical protein [Frankia sp. QA3]
MRRTFGRVKAGKKPGYPRCKGAGWFDSVEWPKDGHVKVNQHRPVLGTVETIRVKREGCRWYALLSCDGVPAEPLPATGAAAGVNPANTSRTCAACGHCHADNRRTQAAFAV